MSEKTEQSANDDVATRLNEIENQANKRFAEISAHAREQEKEHERAAAERAGELARELQQAWEKATQQEGSESDTDDERTGPEEYELGAVEEFEEQTSSESEQPLTVGSTSASHMPQANGHNEELDDEEDYSRESILE